ncbi:MAG: S-methyl-5'-thioadenosine phosphorylase [Anaerolineales bacterium]
MEDTPSLGVIGGSGLYTMPDLENVKEHNITTPFGKPSTPIVVGTLAGVRIAFLARHGIGHHISPTEINFRANIYALKSLGVTRVIGVSACGSLREEYEPEHIVIPNQLFDFTRDRKRSFFGDGFVAHIGVADPFCGSLSDQLFDAVQSTSGTVHKGGTFITIEGARFSTRGESNTYRAWGMDIIGMTTSPEAFLAREAEMCYAVMAHVTDYDVWHISEEPVSVEIIIKIVNKNTKIAQQAIRHLAGSLTKTRNCNCENALADALITNPSVIPAETRKKLSLLVDKYVD